MSETFTKLFGSITDSTIWLEDSDTRIMWVTMLAMADRHGYVGASLPGLAARAHVPLDKAKEAIGKFMGPDPYSRSKDFEGRRIEEADRGWNILNYTRFRDMRDEESRKEYERVRKRAQRSSEMSGTIRDKPGQSRDVPVIPLLSAQAEAEAEADRDTDPEIQSVPSAKRRGTYPPEFEEIWLGMGSAAGSIGNSIKAEAFAQWKAAGKPIDKVIERWVMYIASLPDYQTTPKHVSRWFKAGGHLQDYSLPNARPGANGAATGPSPKRSDYCDDHLDGRSKLWSSRPTATCPECRHQRAMHPKHPRVVTMEQLFSNGESK